MNYNPTVPKKTANKHNNRNDSTEDWIQILKSANNWQQASKKEHTIICTKSNTETERHTDALVTMYKENKEEYIKCTESG